MELCYLLGVFYIFALIWFICYDIVTIMCAYFINFMLISHSYNKIVIE